MLLVQITDTHIVAPGARVYTAMPAAIAAGRSLAQATRRDELFVVGGEAIYAAALPFADQSFDAVVVCRLLHHFGSTAFTEHHVEALSGLGVRDKVLNSWLRDWLKITHWFLFLFVWRFGACCSLQLWRLNAMGAIGRSKF